MPTYPITSISDLQSRIRNLEDAELGPWLRQAADLIGLSAFTNLSSMGTTTVLALALERDTPFLLDLLEELHPPASYPERWSWVLRKTYRFDDREVEQPALARAIALGKLEHAVRLDRLARSSTEGYASAELSLEAWIEVGHQHLRYWTSEVLRLENDTNKGPATEWEAKAMATLDMLESVALARGQALPQDAPLWAGHDPSVQKDLKDRGHPVMGEGPYLAQGWAAVLVERDAVLAFERLNREGRLGEAGTEEHLSVLGECLSYAFKHASSHIASYLIRQTPALDGPNEHGQRWREVLAEWQREPARPMPWSDSVRQDPSVQAAFRDRVITSFRDASLRGRPATVARPRLRRRS